MGSFGTQQECTLRLFTALWLARPVWPGSLLLGIGLGDSGRALALASLATGAAGIFLEEDSAAHRTAQREGCCTFTVNSLEEAVRALKNEVRQKRAISVALRGDVATHLADVVRRGIQPDVLAFARAPLSTELDVCDVLLQRGAAAMQGLGLVGIAAGVDLAGILSRGLGEAWQVRTEAAADMAQRRRFDVERAAGMAARADDPQSPGAAAYRWARVAPSLFPRSLDRVFLAYSS